MSERLTTREREILGRICVGEKEHEIAEALTVSRYTVKAHTEHIRKKLKARTIAQAVYEYVTRYRSSI